MKVVIAGPRDFHDYDVLVRAIEAFIEEHGEITEVVSGAAKGVDTMGEKWAKENSIPIQQFPADWNNLKQEGAVIKTNKWKKKYNANAGFFRNGLMAKYGDALIAIDMGTAGTGNMKKVMKNEGKLVFSYNPDDNMDDEEYGHVF